MQEVLQVVGNWWSNFDYAVGAGIFVISALVDILCVKHVQYVNSRRAIGASNVSVTISLLGVISTLIFINDPLYTLPMLAGQWIGTYIPLKYSGDGE
jgi:hypothetical protein